LINWAALNNEKTQDIIYFRHTCRLRVDERNPVQFNEDARRSGCYGMHLMKEFGLTDKRYSKKTVSELHRHKLRFFKRDDRSSMTDFIGKFITLLIKKLENKPDMILLLGDRVRC